MGRIFARILKKRGAEVVIAGPRPEKGRKAAKELGVLFENDNKKAAKSADIVIITVPIAKTLDVIREVAPVAKKGSLLMDLTSVKKAPCEAMDKAALKGVEILGCHPVFGPTITSFKGQNFVLCPIREGKMSSWMKSLLKKEGARITICSPEEHDSSMGIVQGLTHFMLISAGMAMRDLKFDLQKSRKFSSPVYDLILDVVGRILAQDPKLYAEIQLNNPETKKARDAYMRAVKRLEGIISARNEEAFIDEMTKAAEHFGDTKGSLERTNKLLKK